MKSLKAISAVLAVAALAVVSFAPLAKAQSTDVNALIAQLQAQIASLKSQLGQGTATTGTATFTANLTLGSTGSEVTALQQYLIDHGYLTITAPTGKFGPMTKVSVVKLQKALGVNATGFFGPMTRAALNQTLVVVPPTTGTSTSTTPTSTPATGITTAGAEGSLTVTNSGAVAGGQQLNLNASNVAVSAIDLKAVDSDMQVSRVDLHFNFRPWQFLTNVSLTSGGQTLASMQPSSANVTENTAGNGTGDYLVRFSGLNLVVPKGQIKTVVVAVSTPNAMAYSTSGFAPTVTFLANSSVRAVDGANNSALYGPTSNTSDSFTLKNNLTQGSMVLSLNAATPNSQVVAVSKTQQTQNVEVLRFNVKAQDNSGDVSAVTATFAGTNANINNTIGVAHLVDENGNVLANASIVPVAGATTTGTAFFDLSTSKLMISQDQTRTLKVTVDAQQASTTNGGSLTNGDSIVPTITAMTAEDANYNTLTPSGSAAGYTTYFYVQAPTIALVSANTPSVTNAVANGALNTGSGNITVSVTAKGGDIYVPTSNAFIVTSTAKAVVGNVENPTGSGVATVGANYKISQDSTATFVVDYVMSNASGTAGFQKTWISGFKWNTDNSGAYTTWTNILGIGTSSTPSTLQGALVSPSVNLSAGA